MLSTYFLRSGYKTANNKTAKLQNGEITKRRITKRRRTKRRITKQRREQNDERYKTANFHFSTIIYALSLHLSLSLSIIYFHCLPLWACSIWVKGVTRVFSQFYLYWFWASSCQGYPQDISQLQFLAATSTGKKYFLQIGFKGCLQLFHNDENFQELHYREHERIPFRQSRQIVKKLVNVIYT